MALWGGRFEGKASPLFKRFNDSLRFDWRLVQADIIGSKAWAAAIQRAGVISADDLNRLHGALDELAASAQSRGETIALDGDEDVHSWVERNLIEKVGDLGKRLHTGRSRNDQVCTDLRLLTVEIIGELTGAIRAAQHSLVTLADREQGVVMPGYTHMQRGQPILFSHWCLAYFEMLDRDAARFSDALKRVRVSPLGSGALAGTAYDIDRERLAKDLGFDSASRNSLDAVGDRDFVFEALSCCTMTAIHLSRLAEDLILYCSSEFSFVTLDDSVSSGSSLMPQKKNPDSLELTRGKVGRIIGALVAIATTMKGLPLAYNKDLQEDKEPLLDAADHLLLTLAMIPPVLDTLKVNCEVCRAAAVGDGTILSTELADYLVGKGMAFRDAHEAAGKAVRLALSTGTPLHQLSLTQMQSIDARIGQDVYAALTPEAAVAKRNVLGGTAHKQVAARIAEATVHPAKLVR